VALRGTPRVPATATRRGATAATRPTVSNVRGRTEDSVSAGGGGAGPPGDVTCHQVERMPSAYPGHPRTAATAAPVVATAVGEPSGAAPRSVTVRTRPPQSPLPSRAVTCRAVSRPTAGNCAASAAAGRAAVQLWTGLAGSPASQGSGAAGRYGAEPGTVQPPDEAENWVKAATPA